MTWRHDVRRGGYALQVPAALAGSRRRASYGLGSVISSGWRSLSGRVHALLGGSHRRVARTGKNAGRDCPERRPFS